MKKSKLLYAAACLIFMLSVFLSPIVSASAEGGKKAPSSSGPVYDPQNGYLSIQVASDGRFNSGATGRVTGKSFNISYDWPDGPGTSFTTIKVDSQAYVFGSSSGGAAIIQTPKDGTNLDNTCIWKIGDIEVTQTLQIVNNPSTGRPDMGMYKYSVVNKGSAPHDVGVRIMIDTMLNGNDGAPYRIPGKGAVTTEADFTGANVPEYWQAFYDLNTPDIMAQGTLKGWGATAPDRFAVCQWGYVFDTLWDYTIHPAMSISSDSAVAMWWNQAQLAPNQSKSYATYYGLGTLSGTSDLSITGPVSLNVENNRWSPNPFTVTAYVANNNHDHALTDVPVTLNLPSGLALAEGETAAHTIATINPGEVAQTSWRVVPTAGGTFTYSVTAIEKTAERSITIPVIDNLPPVTNAAVSPQPNANGWINTDGTVTLTASDNQGGSGVKEIHYKAGNENEVTVQGSSASVKITADGVTSILYYAVDNMGNKEPAKNLDIKIDKAGPVITINSPSGNSYKTSDGIVLNFAAADDNSGADNITAQMDGKDVTNGQPFSFTYFVGNHKFTVTATDKAGNVSTKTVEFKVETDGSALPVTGSNVGMLFPVGLSAILGGLFILLKRKIM